MKELGNDLQSTCPVARLVGRLLKLWEMMWHPPIGVRSPYTSEMTQNRGMPHMQFEGCWEKIGLALRSLLLHILLNFCLKTN